MVLSGESPNPGEVGDWQAWEQSGSVHKHSNFQCNRLSGVERAAARVRNWRTLLFEGREMRTAALEHEVIFVEPKTTLHILAKIVTDSEFILKVLSKGGNLYYIYVVFKTGGE